jgi:trigger factor
MEISVELEDVSSVKKRLKVEVPAGIARKEYDQVAKAYKLQARLPGFRPGKAPVELIKRHFKKSIRSDVLQKLIPNSYDQAIREQGVQPIGEPSLDNLTFEEGDPLVYEANFEIHPEIDLPEYKGLKVKVELKPVTQEDVEEELERLRQEHSRLVSVENRFIKKGDHVVIELRGEYLDEEEGASTHEPFNETNVVVNVGDEQTHEAFTQALLGSKVGEEKKFEVEYDSDYAEKELAGHKVLFTVHIEELKEKEIPELNDEFARDLGAYKTMKELREDIEKRLTVEREKNREKDFENKLLEKLVEKTSFELPEVLVKDRSDAMLTDLAYGMVSQGVDPSKANVDWAKIRTEVQPQAEQQVRGSMILSEIGRREDIQISTEELEQELEQMADSMNQPKEKVRQYFHQENRMEGVRSRLFRGKVLKMLLGSAKVSN